MASLICLFFVTLMLLSVHNPAFASAQKDSSCGYNAEKKIYTQASDKKIHMLFATHGAQGGMAWLPDQPPQNKSEEILLEHDIKTYLKKNKTGLANYKNQNAQLKKLIQKKQIKWVGLEMIPKNFKERLSDWKKDVQTWKAAMKKAKIPEATINDAILVSWGPFLAAALNDEPWTKDIEIVAVDSDSSKELHTEIENKTISMLDNEFADLLAKGKIQQNQVDFLAEFYQIKLNGNSTFVTREEREAFLRSFDDPEVKKAVSLYLRRVSSILGTMSDRDSHIAKILFEKTGSGALIMGSSHEKGIAKRLLNGCETNRPVYQRPGGAIH